LSLPLFRIASKGDPGGKKPEASNAGGDLERVVFGKGLVRKAMR
jgi:hypothetical protein